MPLRSPFGAPGAAVHSAPAVWHCGRPARISAPGPGSALGRGPSKYQPLAPARDTCVGLPLDFGSLPTVAPPAMRCPSLYMGGHGPTDREETCQDGCAARPTHRLPSLDAPASPPLASPTPNESAHQMRGSARPIGERRGSVRSGLSRGRIRPRGTIRAGCRGPRNPSPIGIRQQNRHWEGGRLLVRRVIQLLRAG
jgi:hypothetical protein